MEKVCFITLTYSKQKNIKECLLDFNNFIENIKLKFDEFRFLFTYDYQLCGTIFFHILTNQVLSDVAINKFWKHGLFNKKVNCDKNLVLDYLFKGSNNG